MKTAQAKRQIIWVTDSMAAVILACKLKLAYKVHICKGHLSHTFPDLVIPNHLLDLAFLIHQLIPDLNIHIKHKQNL